MKIPLQTVIDLKPGEINFYFVVNGNNSDNTCELRNLSISLEGQSLYPRTIIMKRLILGGDTNNSLAQPSITGGSYNFE
jgi:hypothetical protein